MIILRCCFVKGREFRFIVSRKTLILTYETRNTCSRLFTALELRLKEMESLFIPIQPLSRRLLRLEFTATINTPTNV